MGNNLKTGLTIKILIGCLVGGFICVMLYAFGAYDDIIMDKPAVIVQILGSMIFGAICMGTQIVYDIESWGIRRSTIIHYLICVIAWYKNKGVDRRGQAAAHTALCNLYTKILKINLTTDTYSIVNMDVSEQTTEKEFANSISGWLQGFGKSGQVHEDDLDKYLKNTDLEYLKEYFKSGKTSISIFYRRKYADGFKQVAMEMIPTDDYEENNQALFLYVKNIDM